ncbi:MAG: C10 family peptidase, partial [Sedimentisphaerales bacterium]|nr:C10 family peptidase [Sedimentisphaerales bacterium]
IQAVGQLIYHCGIALESDFEADGTSSSTGKIAPALRNCFNSTCDDYVNKSIYSDSVWYNKIAASIDAGKPVFYTMWSADNSDGHAMVCDGYRNGNEIHLNLGWSGSGTAWYTVGSVSYASFTWTIHGGVFNITPAAYGSLCVTLGPEGALTSGVQWRRTGTSTWFNSGETETGIITGPYTVEFKNTIGWVRPANAAVTILKNQTTELSAVYIPSPEIILGTGTGTDYFPLATSYQAARTQSIYPANEIGGACTLYSLALNIASVPGQTMNQFTIRLKPTALTAFSSAVWDSTGWTVVYQASQTVTASGWNEFVFTTPFEYDGQQNLMVDISFYNSSDSSSGMCYYSTPGGNRTLRYRARTSTYGNPLTWTGASPRPSTSFFVPNIRLTIASKTPDLRTNGFVDIDDYALLSFWWQSSCDVSNQWCEGADLDWSGQIDWQDLDAFLCSWLSEI